MKTYQANLLNAIILIIMPLWAYFTFEGTVEKPEQSITAFIPLFLGVVLLLCNGGLKKENKVIAHIAVLVTLIALIGLTMPLKAALAEERTLSVIRVGLMLISGILAMITFVKSFISARKGS
ncbi:MAG: hypothetical protein CMD06_04125 [Flavobacteriales bacterium]|nr:hypothetical protein [Flavobacteriales bacterium]|tara:strand:- start:42 stop:407 length:366 start_codon:yes stop_codon:yes gene_type:complete